MSRSYPYNVASPEGWRSAARVKWLTEAADSLFDSMEPMDVEQMVEMMKEIQRAVQTGDARTVDYALGLVIKRWEESVPVD